VPSSTVTGDAAASAFVGRAADVRALTDAVAAAGAGRGCVALVSGEPGIGKTSLVAEVVSRVDATVCWSFCRPSDAASAFRLWSTVLDRVRRDVLADAPPALVEAGALAERLLHGAGSGGREGSGVGSAAGLDDRLAAFDAIEMLLHAAANRTPLVVIVEDLHCP
jgi:predicted ATPase